jgi:L-amino acid N-acyltransferase YncA
VSVVIREIVPSEAPVYVALRREMLSESPKSFGASLETDVASDVEGMRKRLETQKNNRTWGAFQEESGELLGAVGGFQEGPHAKRAHAFAVWGMYVTPKARGKGIARKLLLALLDYAEGLEGIRVVCLSVSATASAAEKMYISMGFKTWGTEPLSLQIDGEFYSEIYMVLSI